MKRMLVVALGAFLILSGCAWFETKEEESAQELIQDGVDNFEAGKYRQSIAAFEKLRDWYPFSRYAILAELKIADAYFNLEEYADARRPEMVTLPIAERANSFDEVECGLSEGAIREECKRCLRCDLEWLEVRALPQEPQPDRRAAT